MCECIWVHACVCVFMLLLEKLEFVCVDIKVWVGVI